MEIQNNAICLVKNLIRKFKPTHKGHSLHVLLLSTNGSCGNRDNYCLKVHKQKVQQIE